MIDFCEDQGIYTGSGATIEELTSCQLLLSESVNVFTYLILLSILGFVHIKILFIPFIEAVTVGKWRGKL